MIMAGGDNPFLVQAVYSFKGKNNDELCFKKGDIITVTQREEGGWWEGTLGEKTGWFPSNYVKEYKPQECGSPAAGKISPSKLPPDLVAQQKAYRNLVLKDLIDSEKANVAELQGILKNFLHPLEKSEILSRDEYRQLVGNIGNVVETHQQLLAALEECNQRPALEQRVGRVFLTTAPRIKQVHQAYCAAHPRAVCVLDKYKDELNTFMESQGAASPGLLVLTTGLSKPFRRLEKYAGMLQELERHVEENHPDRGDTQRSVSVYKDIASACSATRRQKELELEVLTGGVRGWEGEDLSCLGEILHMGSVAVGAEHRDRYLVLFPSTLLILSVSQRMSAFIYEGKLPLTVITVSKLEDTDAYKNAFEISGPMIERIVAMCQTREDQQMWVDHLKQQIRVVRKSSVSSPPPASPPASKPQPLPPPHVSLPATSPYARLAAHFASLVKRGIITRKVLKRLLYSQFGDVKVNILGVKVRHSHKVECVIFPQRVSVGTSMAVHTWIQSSSTDSNATSGRRSGTLTRQDAVDHESGDEDDSSSVSSCASNPFGFIRYYSSVHSGSVDDFQGFVDGRNAGLCDVEGKSVSEKATTVLTEGKEKDFKSSTMLQLQSKKNFLELLSSTESGQSSFERTSAHKSFPCAVCEDLTHLDDDFCLETKSKKELNGACCHYVRQSLPSTFQPKHFSPPEPASLYVFPCQTTTEFYDVCMNPKACETHSIPVLPQDSYSPPTTHSSSIDLPAKMIPVPTAVMAELLYNLEPYTGKLQHQESGSSGKSIESISTVCNVPTYSSQGSQDCSQCNVCGDSSTNCSLKKQFNASIDSNSGSEIRGVPHYSVQPKRCYSYQYINIAPNISRDTTEHRADSSCCQYCRNVPCSSRSSDSGLADIAGNNSTMASPDLSGVRPRVSHFSVPPRSFTPRESSELDEFNYEAQCVCTSPFGSTPRTSAQPSLTSEKIFVGSTDSVTPSVTSSCLDPCPLTTPQPLPSEPPMDSGGSGGGIYRSGMYAHWWLKTKLPVSALRTEQPAPRSWTRNLPRPTEEPAHRPHVSTRQRAADKQCQTSSSPSS